MRFFRSHNGAHGGNHEVNMTPLIDVSLVLVVILLLTTPLAFESKINVRQSSQAAKNPKEIERDPRVEIVLLSDETVRVNRTTIARADLGGTLKPLMESSEDRRVVIRCEDGVTHGAFVNVLDQTKISGAGDIAVVEN